MIFNSLLGKRLKDNPFPKQIGVLIRVCISLPILKVFLFLEMVFGPLEHLMLKFLSFIILLLEDGVEL